MRRIACALALFLLPAVSSAGVLVVDASGGPGSDFTAIQPAVNAASPGDTILVRAGDYGPFFTLGKGLSLIADTGAAVTVHGEPLLQTVPAGETLLVRGIDFEQLGTPSGFGVLTLFGNDGAVWIEDCSVTTAPAETDQPWAALYIEDCAQVTVVRSTLVGRPGWDSFGGGGVLTPGGIRAVDSVVHVQDSHLEAEGPLPGGWYFHGGTGLVATDSQVTAEGCVLRGGDGSDGDSFTCTGAKGGHAVFVQGPGASFVGKDNSYEPGAGGVGFGACPVGTPGVEVWPFNGAVASELPTVARSLSIDSPVREGQSFTLSLQGQPFEPVLLLVGDEPGSTPYPAYAGTLLVGGSFLSLIPFGAVDGAGQLSLVLVMPSLPPAADAFDLYVQSVFLDSGTSTHVLAGASALTPLDGSVP